MQQIAISETAYNTFKSLAAKHGQSLQEFVETLAAQQAWEEHAAENYDRHHERMARGERNPVLTEDEFLRSLDDSSGQ